MSITLVPLTKATFWGRVRLPFNRELYTNSVLTVTLTRPTTTIDPNLTQPRYFWKTDQTQEMPITEYETPKDIIVPRFSNYIEFYTMFTRGDLDFQSEFVYQPTNVLAGSEFVDDPLNSFRNFGQRNFSIRIQSYFNTRSVRLKPFNGFGTLSKAANNNILPTLTETNKAFHYASFELSDFERRDIILNLLDINKNPLSSNLSEGLLKNHDWSTTVAPWPAFSNNNNVVGIGVNDNFMVFYNTKTTFEQADTINGNLIPATGNLLTGFLIPAAAKNVILRRKYLSSSVLNALNAAKALKSSVTTLNDCLVFTMTDNNKQIELGVGKSTHLVPEARLTIEVLPYTA